MGGTFNWPPSGGGVPAFTNLAGFPSASGAGNGALAIALDTNIIYESNGSSWIVVAGPADVLSVGTIDSVTASANGASDSANQLIMQSASATVPGLVNNTTQTFSGNKTFSGTISASNLSGTNTGDLTLATVGSTPSALAASLSGQVLTLQPADGTHPGLITALAQTLGGTKTFTSPVLLSDGSVSAPGIAFSAEANTGLFRTGTNDVAFAVGGLYAWEAIKSGSNVNIGFGPSGTATNAGAQPVSFISSNNSPQYFTFSNLSAGTSSSTIFNIGNGAGSNYTTVENWANTTSGYLAGGSALFASPNQTQLNIGSEYAAGYITFNVGGRTLATEAMRLSTTSLTLNKGWGILNFSGSSSGVVTIQPQAAAGTFNFNLPTTAGTSGQALLSGGGSASPMTWGNVLTNPMTTLGDIIYENATPVPARLAGNTSATLSVLTQTGTGSVSAAPVWTSSTGTGNVVLASAPTLTSPVVGTQAQGDGSTKAASTSYVDVAVANAVAGVNPAVAVQAATTAASDTSGFTYANGVSGIGATFTGSVNTAVVIDGYTFTALGQRLLVKNDTQSPSGAFNGIYYVTQVQTGILAPIFTRALDYDQPSDINNTGAIPVINGTANGTTSWVQTAQIVTVGTTPLIFAQFTKNPANYLLAANNLSDVSTKATAFNNVSPMTTKGDLIGYSTTNIRVPVGSNGQFVGADSTATAGYSWQNPINWQNQLINGAFDYWQTGITFVVTATGGGTPTATYGYAADQWYINNILGGGTVEGAISIQQQAGVTNGSQFRLQSKITTAPTGTGIQNGNEIYQVLSNKASLPLYGQTASFSVLVRGLNNVSQVGVQFYYATTEAKLTTAIGSEILTTVNGSTFTACTINGQALGTSQTVNGVIGVRIRPTAVSSGNLYDLNNGLEIEQAMLNLGPVAMPFTRKYNDPSQELASCQYFFEKNYDVTTAPGSSPVGGTELAIRGGLTTAAHLFRITGSYKVPKRVAPTMTFYSPTTGTAGQVRDLNSSVDIAATNVSPNSTGWGVEATTSGSTTVIWASVMFLADARI